MDSRLAEIVSSLSLATEAAAGVPPETAARAAIVATRVAESMGGGTQERQDVYYASLLRYIGCTSFAHETAWYGGGDDIALLRTMTPADSGSLADVAKHIVGGAAKGAGAVTRARSVARLLGDPSMPKRLAEAHCNQAARLAAHLGAAARVTDIMGQTYERFDGKGLPGGLRGDAISPLARVMHVAYRAVLHGAFEGPAAALEVVRARRGGELDPAVCDAFMRGAAEHLQLIGATSVWDQVAAAEPSPRRFVSSERLPQVARAFAHFVDLKSPYTIGHSVGVSRLCEAALGRAGASDEEREQGRLAGFLHDLGRASVPNGIWDKPAPLNVVERERVEQHVYQSERVLARAEVLAPLAKLVGAHHERIAAALRLGGQPRLARAIQVRCADDAKSVAELTRRHAEYRARFASVMAEAKVDVLLCPPCIGPAFRHGSTKDLGPASVTYTSLFNLLAYPAGVVTTTSVRADETAARPRSRERMMEAARLDDEGSEGLPVGVQIVAEPGREDRVLTVMEILERGATWRTPA